MRRTLSVLTQLLAAASVAGALAGCSSDSGSGKEVIGSDSSSDDETSDDDGDGDTKIEAKDFQVESGFTFGVDSIGTRYTSAGARLTNPNTDLAAYEVQVLFNLVGAGGKVLDTQTETVSYIGPGASVPVAPLQIGFEIPTNPTDLQVQVVGEFVEDEGPKGLFGGDAAILDFKGGEVTKSDFGREFSGQVSNPTDVVVTSASWSCIWLNGTAITGGASSSIVDPIPPGATVQFSESFSIDKLVAKKVECQVIADLE